MFLVRFNSRRRPMRFELFSTNGEAAAAGCAVRIAAPLELASGTAC